MTENTTSDTTTGNNEQTVVDLFTPLNLASRLAEELGVAYIEQGDGYLAPCPCHQDSHPSLSVSAGEVVPVLVKCWAGCDQGLLLDTLKERGLWSTRPKESQIVDEYPYRDAEGEVLCWKQRHLVNGKKKFKWGRVGADGRWKNHKPRGCLLPLYRLPELLESDPTKLVVIVEGEKDVENLRDLGVVATCNHDGAGNWLDRYTPSLEGRHVAVIPDNDAPGRSHAIQVAQALADHVESIKILTLPDLELKGDFSDWLHSGGDKEKLTQIYLEAPEWAGENNWEARLKTSNAGEPKNLESNYALYLRNHDQFKGLFRYDEFNAKVTVFGQDASDHLDTKVVCMFQDFGFNTTRDRVTQAIRMVSRENSHDPLRDYVLSLVWDKKPRIDTWLRDYMKATEQSEAYVGLVGRRWLVSGIARALEPGCKADQWLILEGKQGDKKSWGLKHLVPDDDWYSASLPKLSGNTHKDAVMSMSGSWIVEDSEFKVVKKGDRDSTKAFASTMVDKIRIPYDKHLSIVRRRCIIAATHNPEGEGYFSDPTGARRWLPVAVCGKCDRKGLKRDRDQLWAEALHFYQNDEPWWIEPEEAGLLEEQRSRFKESEVVDEAKQYLEYQPIIIDDTNKDSFVVEWKKRVTPLTVFIPKYFWVDRYQTDWVKAPWQIKNDINGYFQIRGWKKLRVRVPEQAKEHGDPERLVVRAWCVTPESGGVTTPVTDSTGCNQTEKEGLVTGDTYNSNNNNIIINRKGSGVASRNTAEKCPDEVSPVTVSPNGVLIDLEILPLDDFFSRFPPDQIVGLDVETTSLSPIDGEVKLMQFYRDGVYAFVKVEDSADLITVVGKMSGRTFVAFNAQFEQSWLLVPQEFHRLEGNSGVEIHDSMLAYSALFGGRISLKDACKKFLKTEVSKEQQKSDWSGDLTDDQILYALKDAEYALLLWQKFAPMMEEKDVLEGYFTMLEAIPAINHMEASGLGFDLKAHDEMIVSWMRRKAVLTDALIARRDEAPVDNWNSPAQIQAWIKKALEEHQDGKVARRHWQKTQKTQNYSVSALAIREVLSKGLVPEPIASILKVYMDRQTVSKLLSTYGMIFNKKVQQSGEGIGRLHGSFSIGSAQTGRMTSSSPNLQNLPNGEGFKTLFIPDPGNKIVVADYSQIEVRVGGILANEPVLAEIFRTGQDVNRATAARMFGKPQEEISKQERKQAKTVTFGVQYGMQERSLSKALKVTVEEASEYLAQWEEVYPAYAQWRLDQVFKSQDRKEIRMAGGRLVQFEQAPNPSVCYNYPVQGASADVMYKALTRTYDAIKGRDGWRMLAVVHDEIVMEVPERDADPRACGILEEAMVLGFLDIFPGADTTGLVDAVSGDSWAVKE